MSVSWTQAEYDAFMRRKMDTLAAHEAAKAAQGDLRDAAKEAATASGHGAKRAKPHKYHAKAVVCNGIRFDSKKEANRYRELLLLHRAGKVLYFLRQVPFDLGGGAKYRVDFMVVYSDGRISYEDVKGYETSAFRQRKRIVEARYPVTIEVI